MYFNDIDSLMSHIDNNLGKGTEFTAEVIEDIVKDYIREELYKVTETSTYENTWDFYNSVVHTKTKRLKNGNWTVDIIFDTDKIIPRDDSNHFFNPHKAFPQKGSKSTRTRDVSEYIPLWIEEGTENNPYYEHKGINSSEYVLRYRPMKNILDSLVKYLSSLGIDAVHNF